MHFFSTLISCALAGPALAQAGVDPRGSSYPTAAEYEGYAFLYFKNNDERLYLAISNDNNILSFSEVNNGNPILTSTQGTKGLRDPYLIRSKEGDKFFILATDLCAGCGIDWGQAGRWGSRYLEIWETPDLINFSEQHHTLVSPYEYGMSWAPEAIYNPDADNYLVHWGSSIYNDTENPGREEGEYIRIVYSTTQDFKTFSEPVVWEDFPPEGRVDASVFRDGDGTYYRFTKGVVNGCSDFVQDSSPSLTANQADWKFITSCIGKDRGTGDLEGPVILKTNPGDINGERYVLLGDMIIDGAGNRGYVPFETDSLSSGSWTLKDVNTYPFHPRHGVVQPLTGDEINALRAAYGATSG
jgi:hypothetical protein